ncbi:SusC/RagA family TonB-linked outer membrane protein [Dyadobacter luteus]|uniref:SusC/RagA family TonB-linked outer membrane protein n=1 Tax=Dyadobacter luteus TaxID=2259619 RepID=A0A3D8YAV0_9BACT|nr:SusC/RagA family TonB-linked outer membrane protein [Dyadobacter luteus]REA60907.1 SusC/RagA family TonB-linked outer membrane protein [Dyadobacter luteus]
MKTISIVNDCPKRAIQICCVLFVVILCSVMPLYAQTLQVKGRVVQASDKQSVPGVSILVKGTNVGTLSDADGRYELGVPAGGVLVFSSVGFSTQEIAPGSRTELNVEFSEDSKALSEVVVTALGIKKESRTVGYTTQDVAGSELVKARESNPINSLTGKIAGLTVGISSEMLARPQLVLRGNTDVLFVVDGVPINSDTWNISPDDIETYTVLKGPNAAALYGFRGQNGAILITTKKGSKDKRGFSIELNSSTMLDKGFVALPQVQNEYGAGSNYKYKFGDGPYDEGGTDRRPNVWGPRFEGQGVAQYDSPIGADGKRTLTPWIARGANNFQNFMQTGVLTNNNIAISSSGEKSDMRMSLSHTFQKGTSPNTQLQSVNFNLSAGYDFSSKIRLEGNINFNRQFTPNFPDVSYGPNSYTYMFMVYGSAHWDQADMRDYYKTPGKPGVQQYFQEYGRNNNPYFMAHEWLRGHYKNDVYGFAKLNYKVNDFISLSARTQITTWNLLRTEKLPTSMIIYGRDLKQGDYREDRRNLFENNTDVLATLNKNITPDINVSAVVGGNIRSFNYNSSYASTDYLIVPGVYNLSNSKNPKLAYNFQSDMSVLSAYYSADFSYKNLLTLSTTGRVDKLSTLPKGNKSYFYPSVSASTVVSDYINMPQVISFAKLRASYANVKGGLTNSTIGAAYLPSGQARPLEYGSEYYTSYDGPSYANQNTYTIKNLYNNTPSADYTGNLANSSLHAYSVESYEAGIDMKFLRNRLSLDVTYFQNDNGPRIFQLGVDPATGHTSRNINGLVTRKKGLEISLSGTPIKTANGLNWTVMANYSSYQERIKEIYEGANQILLKDHYYQIGDRLDEIYAYQLVRDREGNVIHNSGGLPLTSPTGTTYKQFAGHSNSKFVWGINNRFSYKALSLSFQFDGRVGGKILDEVWKDGYQSGRGADLTKGAFGEARMKEWEGVKTSNVLTGAYVGQGVMLTGGSPAFGENGQITNYDELEFAPNTKAVRVQSYALELYNLSTPFYISRSYLKLREVVIGYSIPARILGNSFVKGASVSLIGRNLLYFAARKDIDLDQYPSADIVNPPLQSPSTRKFGINLNVTF